MWSWGWPTYAQKQAKNVFFVFSGFFWAYVGQPHDHIGWATTMPFTSINPTNPRTNPWKFHEKILRIGGAGKWGFLSRPFWISLFQKKITFCFILMKTSSPFIWGIIYFCTMDSFFRISEKTSSELMNTTVFQPYYTLLNRWAYYLFYRKMEIQTEIRSWC